jgi:hypothetical protein
MCQMLKLVKANAREMMWRSSSEFDSQRGAQLESNITFLLTMYTFLQFFFFFFGGGGGGGGCREQLVRKVKKKKKKKKKKKEKNNVHMYINFTESTSNFAKLIYRI